MLNRVKSLKAGNSSDWSQGNPKFPAKVLRQRKKRVPEKEKEKKKKKETSFSDDRPLLETLDLFEICHGVYQPLNFLDVKRPCR